MRRLKISIEGVDPKPGEIIVAKCNNDYTNAEDAKQIFKILQRTFKDNEVVIIPCDFQIRRLSKEQIEGFIKYIRKTQSEGERENNNM